MSGNYTIATRVNDRHVSTTRIADPFVHHRIVIGWPDLLRSLLRRRCEVVVAVDADRETVERVMSLNPDYLGPPGSPSREAWNRELEVALTRLAAGEGDGRT